MMAFDEGKMKLKRHHFAALAAHYRLKSRNAAVATDDMSSVADITRDVGENIAVINARISQARRRRVTIAARCGDG